MEADGRCPSVLIFSSAEKCPSEIVKLILGLEELPSGLELENGVTAYPWHIDTKYYEADVNLCIIRNKMISSQELAETVQAVVLYFDSNQNEGLHMAGSWLPFVKDYYAEVKIMLCSCCEEKPAAGVSKLQAQEWCVKEGFELVELEPEVDEEWEAEQDFIETNGIKRVIQALHAHVWPNLVMKERKEPTKFQGLLHGGKNIHHDSSIDADALNLDTATADFSEGNIEERLSELMESDTEFSELFSQLHIMKERVSSLPHDQRKACAEQVVFAFWKAIGGDEEELELSDKKNTSSTKMEGDCDKN